MKVNSWQRKRGFSLVELMIVVAIIGILAAIAIPNFVRYTLHAKTVEALTMLGSMKARQFAFYADRDCFARLQSTPPAIPPVEGTLWASALSGFAGNPCSPAFPLLTMADLDVFPGNTMVRFTYACEVDPSGTEFSCNAIGDLDADGQPIEMVFCTDNALVGGAPVSPVLGTVCSFPWNPARVSVDRY